MDLFLIHFLVLVWASVAVFRHAWPAGRIPRLLGWALAAAWLLLAGRWTGELVHAAVTPPVPPPLRPVRAADPAPEPASFNRGPAPGRVFTADLLAPDATLEVAPGELAPATGPLPGLNLPRLRGALRPVVRLRVPPQPDVKLLRLSFSARLHQRNRAGLAVTVNGQPMRQFRLGGATTWLDEVVEFVPQAGENVIELRDVPLRHEPDWMEYLERYPDVRRNLVSLNIPLEAGAEAHYEAAGRQEGRTVRQLDTLPPETDAYYFLFRQLRVEGFNAR
jgi:hypothetical protein